MRVEESFDTTFNMSYGGGVESNPLPCPEGINIMLVLKEFNIQPRSKIDNM